MRSLSFSSVAVCAACLLAGLLAFGLMGCHNDTSHSQSGMELESTVTLRIVAPHDHAVPTEPATIEVTKRSDGAVVTQQDLILGEWYDIGLPPNGEYNVTVTHVPQGANEETYQAPAEPTIVFTRSLYMKPPAKITLELTTATLHNA